MDLVLKFKSSASDEVPLIRKCWSAFAYSFFLVTLEAPYAPGPSGSCPVGTGGSYGAADADRRTIFSIMVRKFV